ncbi:hypothetical protein ADIS_1074 [Lunatimonas lonarensis]|uniref:Uncharacterized protein n=1 Tax=Lunatimonas lonarensis TaxID=1232681 RepID=R7ZWR4_9BACT|nr:hypothetical protein ADIS_1074 [Lunatimonas lonarensis]
MPDTKAIVRAKASRFLPHYWQIKKNNVTLDFQKARDLDVHHF